MTTRTATRNGVEYPINAANIGRRAVRLALELRPNLSDRAIAQHCGVGADLVGVVRRGASGVGNRHLPAQPRVGLDGKTYPAVLLDAQVIKGSRDDARWHAAGANTTHGLKRTTADKQRAVRLALELRPNLSDRAIAQHCGVAVMTVGAVRRGESGVQNGHLPAQPRVGLDGKTYPARRPEPRAQATESPAEPSDPWEDSEGEDETAAAPAKAVRP